MEPSNPNYVIQNPDCGRRLGTTLARALLILRLAIAGFIAQWAIGRIVASESSDELLQTLFHIKLDPGVSEIFGGIQLIIIAAFVTGFRRGVSYGAVFLMNLAALGATWRYILDPYGAFEHRLFWNAIPVVAACLALLMLRHHDALGSVDTLLDRQTTS